MKVIKKSFWQRGYGRSIPHRPVDSSSGRRPNTIGGGGERMRGRRGHLETDDSMDPYSPCVDEIVRSNETTQTSMRKDSAAATTIKSDASRRGTVPDSVEESLTEDLPLTPTTPISQVPRLSFDFDLERNTLGAVGLETARDDFDHQDQPSLPEAALPSSRRSRRRPSLRWQNPWRNNSNSRGVELDTVARPKN